MEALKRNAQIWDVRSTPDFAKGHLPGARSVVDAASLLRDPNSEETGVAIAQSASLKLQTNPAVMVSTSEMMSRKNASEVQIIDVRTPKEFTGEDIRALRGGHIPGAINIPYEQNWADPDTQLKLSRKQVTDSSGMSLKPVADLKSLYAGLDPDKETVVYCQSGVRASETAG